MIVTPMQVYILFEVKETCTKQSQVGKCSSGEWNSVKPVVKLITN